jgi:cytochrome P450
VSKRDLRRQLPPGPTLPAPVQLVAFWKRPASSLERLRQQYGSRITVQLPFQPPFVMLSDPEEIKELFTAPADVLHPGEGARILEPVVGPNSVILLDGTTHLEQRKLLLPAFHGEKMQRLAGLMTELAQDEVESWPRDRALALHPRLQRLTLEIILRTVFGLEQGPRLNELRDLLTEVLAFGENPLSVLPAVQRVLSRLGGPLGRFNELVEQADRLVYELIEERRANGRRAGDDVLALLLSAKHEDGSPMSSQELRDELMTALVAGHETTASQLAWAFERLAREPAALDRLVAELDAGESEDFLVATINEILRLKPVLPNAEPRMVKQPVTIGGFEYPPGVLLLASAFLVHHDPGIYPDPYAFRPERFLGKTPGTYTWIPFGGGRRRCLGASFAVQEMRIVLREVLTRHELAPASEQPERTARRSITFSPAGRATVVLRERRVSSRPQAQPALAA